MCLKVMRIAISLRLSGMMLSSSTIVLGNTVGKVNEGSCVYWGSYWSDGWVNESDVRGGRDDFLDCLKILLFGVGPYVSA